MLKGIPVKRYVDLECPEEIPLGGVLEEELAAYSKFRAASPVDEIWMGVGFFRAPFRIGVFAGSVRRWRPFVCGGLAGASR